MKVKKTTAKTDQTTSKRLAELYNISTGQYQVLVNLVKTGIGQVEDFDEFQEKTLALCVNERGRKA